MKKLFTFFGFSFLTTVAAIAQDTTKILFIGNSFTGANDLQSIVNQFFVFDGNRVITEAFAPGGISVGDVEMGTAAHMNNPAVFELIRSKDWDFLVLQDNQGRFALDSAIFPSTTRSKVVEGHIKIRDSFHHYHSCGKMIWFSGWGFQDEDTTMIKQITTNYEVLNDSAKDVIAPIGYAWKKSFVDNPSINLWSPDRAHPAVTGSFLTAAIIYGTISRKDVSVSMFNHSLPPHQATQLKLAAQQTLTDLNVKRKSNLNGIASASLKSDKTKLIGPKGKKLYRWYSDNKFIAATADSVFKPAKSGTYKLWTLDEEGFWQKSCELKAEISTGIQQSVNLGEILSLYPNPATESITIKSNDHLVSSFGIYAMNGQLLISFAKEGLETNIPINSLAAGFYFVKLFDENGQSVQNSIRFIKQ